MASFNDEQQKAISASADKNILISAGAGSGKTKTLTERVFNLIDQGKVKPSELLVRTFTNNAAHERKERIVSRFEKAKQSETNPAKKERYKQLSDERLSAHVQTFDSFSQYLAVSYAARLGISPNITIADEVVRETKRQVILDSLLRDYYLDEEKSKPLFDLVHSLSRQNDRSLRQIILDIEEKRASITEEEKNRFFNNYENTYLSDEILLGFKEEYIQNTKKKIIHELKISYLLSDFYSSTNSETGEVDVRIAHSRLNNTFLYNLKYDELPFANELEQKLYSAYLELLKKEHDDFLNSLSSFCRDNQELLSITTRSEKSKFGGKGKGAGFFHRKKILSGSEVIIHPITGDAEELIKRAKDRKQPIIFLLSLVKELDQRIEDYKRISNVFTFADVDKRALSLLIDDQYQDIADEIRERFTYIMVDEYQDTNDAQEQFLNALRKPHKDGKRAHIFCVGDAKQSIYGFRNSKVELFRNRQKDYQDNPDHGEVITRNRNYRSQPLLLHQINQIFVKYRTLEHGGIDYQCKDEQLNYDELVDLYKDKKRQNHQFGISRIISTREDYDGARCSLDRINWEINAIADDIEKKRKDGFEIYDRDIGGMRKVRYSDFGILCRVKTQFNLFQEVFQQRNIPLNSCQEASLSEVEPVIVIESLVGLRAFLRGKNPTCQVKHLFASVARSYIRNYSDKDLFKLLVYGKDREHPQGTLDLIRQDPLWEKREKFIEENKDKSFTEIYTNRISEFHILEELYRLGNIYVSVSKLESRKTRIENQEDSGEGREDFLALRQNRNKYRVDFVDKSSIRNADAVNLRTIHGSKGLERNILYRPITQNKFTGGNPRNNPDYDFSLKYGILLPNYSIHPQYDRNGELIGFPDEEYMPFNYKRYKREDRKKADKDEHVRLFYVAVTRAENNLIFVGDGNTKETKDRKDENALYRLERLHHVRERNPLLLKDPYRNNELTEKREELDSLSFPLLGKLKDDESNALYKDFAENYILSYYRTQYQNTRDAIRNELGNNFRNQFLQSDPGLDELSTLFAYQYWKKDITGFSQLNAYLDSLNNEEDEQNEDDEEDEADESAPFGREDRRVRDRAVRADYLFSFKKALKEGDAQNLGIEHVKNMKENQKRVNIAFLLSLANYLSKTDSSNRIEYATRRKFYIDDYRVPFTIFDKKKRNGAVSTCKAEFIYPVPDRENGLLNDSEIEFKEIKKIRASKQQASDEGEREAKRNYGTYLHALRQCLDLKKPDISLVPGSKEKFRIGNVLNTPLRRRVKDCDTYRQEFHYDLDDDEQSRGSIDLLFVKGNEFYIVDYKTKDITDEAYPKQLHVYQHVVEKLYPSSIGHIHLYLLSLRKAETKEIETEKEDSSL